MTTLTIELSRRQGEEKGDSHSIMGQKPGSEPEPLGMNDASVVSSIRSLLQKPGCRAIAIRLSEAYPRPHPVDEDLDDEELKQKLREAYGKCLEDYIKHSLLPGEFASIRDNLGTEITRTEPLSLDKYVPGLQPFIKTGVEYQCPEGMEVTGFLEMNDEVQDLLDDLHKEMRKDGFEMHSLVIENGETIVITVTIDVDEETTE